VGKRTIYVLTIVVLVIAVVQLTPLAFLQKDAADFVWGLAAGLGIGAVVTWFASRT
jgi:hypothetical protein